MALKLHNRSGPSEAAIALASKLAVAPQVAADVQAMRDAYEVDFTIRAKRALACHAVITKNESINGRDCLIVEPADGEIDRTGLYLFGGGYVAGQPFFELPILAPLVVQTRARIVVPAYPLAPEAPYPAAFEHVCAVYQACINPTMFLAGESAGGGLALALAQHAVRQKGALPAAMALFSPWVDLSAPAAAVEDPTLSEDFLNMAARAYAGGIDLWAAGLSPLQGVMAGLPPTILSTGTRDKLRNGVVALHQKLSAAGGEVEIHDWQGLWHVFEFYDELPESMQSVTGIARFLTRHQRQK